METIVAQTASDTTFTEFNIRHDVGTPHFVRLYDKATRRLERQLKGLLPAPAAGSAAGGILLGTIELTDQYSINVQDFTPVACEHRRDGRSSFLTCPAQCFRNAVRRASENSRHNLSVIGYYRSQGPAGFSLEKEDHDIFKKHMAQDPRLLLIVKPYPGSFATGTFYLGLGSQLHADRSTVEFPVSLKELLGGEPSESSFVEDATDFAANDAVLPLMVRETMSLAAALAAPAPMAPAPIVPAPIVPGPAVKQALSPEVRPSQFWKGAAVTGVVLVSLFGVHEMRKTTPEATVVNQAPAAPIAVPATQGPPNRTARTEPQRQPEPATKTTAPAPAPQPAGQPETATAAPRAEAKKFVPPPANSPALATPILSAVAPEITPSRTMASGPASSLSMPPVAAPRPPAPSAPIRQAVEPVKNPPVPAVVAPAGPINPARAIRQSAPVLPDAVRRKLRGESLVAVRVDLDASGKVTNAVVLTKGNKQVETLAGFAVEAARQSQFEAATRGDQKVPGQVTLQFRFEGEVIRLPVQPSIR